MTTGSAVTAVVVPGRGTRDLYGRLRFMVALTIVLTVVAWLVATVLLLRSRATVASAVDGTNPAYLASLAAHAALSDTDRAAWQSFRSGEARLIGPGQLYRDDITTAGENLVRLAELDTTGATGRQMLLAVNGQLVTYQGLVEQADATYRQGSDELGYAYLTYSSNLLHGSGGLLSRIDEIAELNRRALYGEAGSAWVEPASLLVVVVASGVLLGHLVRVQVFVSRAFRRTVNPPLLGATLLLCGLTIWTVVVMLDGHQAFRSAERQAVPELGRIWQAQIHDADVGAGNLRENRPMAPSGGLDVAATAPARRRLDAFEAVALRTGGLTIGLPLGAIAIAGLAVGGLRLRLKEFG